MGTEAFNIRAMVNGKGNIILDEGAAIPKPNSDQVLLKMAYIGICGSDLKYWKYGKCGKFDMGGTKMVIGHEGSGIVEAVGDKVTCLQKGDRVAIEPGIPCRLCHFCKEGRYNLCPEIKFCATPPVDGNLCQYFIHDADFCFKLPANVSLEEGALVEPLAVAIYSCERAKLKLGHKVFIAGAGPVGILTLKVCKLMGAAMIVLTDINDYKLQTAQQHGADGIINVRNMSNEHVKQEVCQLLGGPADVSFECAGSDATFSQGIMATVSGGCVVQVGRGSTHPQLPMLDAMSREVDIKGIFRYANCYPRAIKMLATGAIDVKSLITTPIFSLEQSQAAFTKADPASNNNVMKIMIKCNAMS